MSGAITQLLQSFELSDLLLIGTVAATVLAVFILARALYPEELVQEIRETALERKTAGPAAGRTPQRPPGRMRAFGGAFVHKIGNYNAGLVRPGFRAQMGRKFTAMGRPELRPQDFIAQQQLYCVFFGLLGLMALNMLQRPLIYAVVFAVFGFVFPHIWLRDQILRRQRAITKALPYNVDLLTLTVEAGLDFQAALATVVEKGQPGPLVEELSLVIAEIKLGKTRAEALRNFADRVQISDVAAFVANVIQADKMGTDLGKVLRIQTTQMRINRTHRAEKAANEAPVKMLFPLIFCIFPTVFFVLFGPIVYRLMYTGG